jgi:hypothetical protein
MRVLNPECFRERASEVFLVHLRVALDRVVLHVFGDVAQFGERFVS